MQTIILTITESERELISGIPEYLTVESNEPANIYYTIDGSTPTEESELIVDKVYLPTYRINFTLKIKAFGIDSESDIFEEYYSSKQEPIRVHRKLYDEGIDVLPYGATSVDSFGVDVNDDPVLKTSIPKEELSYISSTRKPNGEMIPDGTSYEFINFQKRKVSAENSDEIISTINNNVNFNPKAKVIIIKGYSAEDKSSQEEKIINRNYSTFNEVLDSKRHFIQDPIMTGNFVRYMINPETKKIVFYYAESKDNRWLKSEQKLDDFKEFNFSVGTGKQFVFEWIEDRCTSKIY